ncbi:response regulator transcription factor [Cellulomonas sp. ATA003]|uniref:response regulator transcription factor n=1 Tax=Cellulomonas sp. ATA003 TaxID=3073064 RepID=UPI002873CBD2|nr:response regulator transcription factor [Cellulomonas sp. ATA003]WNB85385.1 response regulator transcription factor [Cellulomonas sp. ATA003]
MAAHTAAPTRVLVVDDHVTFAELLADALDREPDLVSVGHAVSVAESVEMSRRLTPDLVVMDVQLPDGDGFVATRRITDRSPATRVVMLTAQADVSHLTRARLAGACGLLLKDGSLAHLLLTLRTATHEGFRHDPSWDSVGATTPGPDGVGPGRPALTRREREVLTLLAEGREVRDIAATLGVTPATCRGYVKSLLVKLDAHSQLQAVVAAWRLGLLTPRTHD